jgi:hypothetical protein
MKLFHGTTTAFLASIQRHGLRPRKTEASNWKQNPSRSDMVYLTTAYPFYFATMSRDEKVVVVFEIDAKKLDKDRLYPDEDYVTHVAQVRHGKPLAEEQKRHACDNLDLFRGMWRKSLAFLGNCAYRGTIPPKVITRYCLFDSAARPDLAFHCMDASINPLNYQFQGRQFAQVVGWFFGDRKLLPMIVEAESDEERKFWLAQSKDRTGIEVVTVRKGGKS